MANSFRNRLQAVSDVFVAILLWAGLGFVPSYANDADVTYYAFVMHKPIGENWQFFSQSALPYLGVGSYRFQIVVYPPLDNLSKWLAVRGEFLFVNDEQHGGVMVSVRKTLDDSQEVGRNNIFSSLWNESDRRNKWEKAGQKWVQPFIEKMRLEKPTGSPDPNFMRFLILKKEVEETWERQGKKYRLYRLHYFTKYALDDEHKQALSRFINPGKNLNTDIRQLNQWVGNQDAFTLAKYVGKPDNNHKEFYWHFKTWFNQLSSNNEDISMPTATENENVQTLLPDWIKLGIKIIIGILFVVIVAIIGIAVGLPKKMQRKRRSRQTNDNTNALSSEEQPRALKRFLPFLHKKNAKIAPLSKPFSYVSITEFELLKKELEQFRGTVIQNQKNIEFLHKKSMELEKNQKAVTPSRDSTDENQVSSAPIRAEDFQQALADTFSELLYQHVTDLSQHPDFKRLIKTQIGSFFNERFKSELDEQIKFYAESYWNQLLKNHQSKQIAVPTPSVSTSNAETSQTTPEVGSTTNKVIEKLKSVFLTIKSVNEDALNRLETTVEPCTFVTNVVTDCLKPNQPITHYQSLDNAIQELTGGKVCLIISNVGDDIDKEKHNVVSQQTVTKDKLNVVASLIRPGVRCDNVVRRKADIS